MNENILEIVGDAYLKKGLLKKDTYRLVFTEERVIFSHVTKEIRKEEQKQLAEDLKGKKFRERLGAAFHMSERITEKYSQFSLDEILAMGTESFSILYKDIKKVKRHTLTDEQNIDKTTVILTTMSSKLKFTFSDERAATKIYKMLKAKSK